VESTSPTGDHASRWGDVIVVGGEIQLSLSIEAPPRSKLRTCEATRFVFEKTSTVAALRRISRRSPTSVYGTE
jgi:hypothetical protein